MSDLAKLLEQFIEHSPDLSTGSRAAKEFVDLVDVTVAEELLSVLAPEIVSARLAKYVLETREGLDDMADMFTLHRTGEVAQLAHRLSGGASVFGAVDFASSLSEIERRVLEGDLSNWRSDLDAARALAERSFLELHYLMPSAPTALEQPMTL